MGKRASVSPKDQLPAKILKKGGVAKSKYNAVVEALDHPLAEGFTKECRAMLTEALPLSLCVPADQRHEIQQEVVDMIGAIVGEVAEKLHAAVEAEAAASADVMQKEAGLRADLTAATAAFKEAKDGLEASKTALGASTTAHAEAGLAYTKSQDDQRRGDKEMQVQVSEKGKVDAVIGSLAAITSGQAPEGTTMKAHVSAVTALAGKLSLEKSLQEAMPTSLVKGPDSRATFDSMLLAQLSEIFKKKAEELDSAISALRPASEQRVAAVEAAQKALQDASAAKDGKLSDVTAAKAKLTEAKEAKEKAEASLAEHKPEEDKVAKAMKAKQDEAANFNAKKAIFEELKNKKSKVADLPEAEAPAAEAVA